MINYKDMNNSQKILNKIQNHWGKKYMIEILFINDVNGIKNYKVGNKNMKVK